MALGGGLAQAFVRLHVDSSVVAADTSKGIEEGAASADVESAGASAGERTASAFNKAFKFGMIGVLAAAAIGAVAIKSAIDFQMQMTKIQTQAGASASEVKQLADHDRDRARLRQLVDDVPADLIPLVIESLAALADEGLVVATRDPDVAREALASVALDLARWE